MKIVDLKAMTIRMNGWHYPIVKIETDDGIHGLGEARDGADKRLLLDLKRLVLGEDPTNVERLFQKIRALGGRGSMGRQGGGVSGVEMALLDIAGKAAGLPVYKLIGGKRRGKIRAYVDSGEGVLPDGSRPPRYPEVGWEQAYTTEAFAEKARRRKALDFTIIKFDLGYHGFFLNVPGYAIGQHTSERGLKAQVSCVRAVKGGTGRRDTLCLDLGSEDYLASSRHMAVHSAIQLCRVLEPFDILWVEDALSNAHLDGWIRLTSSTTRARKTGGFHHHTRGLFIRVPSSERLFCEFPDPCIEVPATME